MKGEGSTEMARKDTEEVLRTFLKHDLEYRKARLVEIQCVHCIGKSKGRNPHPILACQQIFSLVKGTNFQMFQDLPHEINTCSKVQMGACKDARRNEFASANVNLIKPVILWPIRQKNCHLINTKSTL